MIMFSKFHDTELINLNCIDPGGKGEISSVNNIFEGNSEVEDITIGDLSTYIVKNKTLLDSQVLLSKMKMI